MNNCIYCNKTFSCKSSYNRHLKTSKMCASIRGEVINTFKCEYCSYNTPNKLSLIRHAINCKGKDQYIINLKVKSDILQNENEYKGKLLDKLITKPNNVINQQQNNNLTYNKKIEVYSQILDDINEFIPQVPALVNLYFTKNIIIEDQVPKCILNIMSHKNGKLYYSKNERGEYRYLLGSSVKMDDNKSFMTKILQPHILQSTNNILKETKLFYAQQKSLACLNNDFAEEKELIQREEKEIKQIKNIINIINTNFSRYIDAPIMISNTTIKDHMDDPLSLKRYILEIQSPNIIDTPIESIITSSTFISTLKYMNIEILDIMFDNIDSYINYIFTHALKFSINNMIYYYNQIRNTFWYYVKERNYNKKIEEEYPEKFYQLFFYPLNEFFDSISKGNIYREKLNTRYYYDALSLKEPIINFFKNKKCAVID